MADRVSDVVGARGAVLVRVPNDPAVAEVLYEIEADPMVRVYIGPSMILDLPMLAAETMADALVGALADHEDRAAVVYT